MRKIKKIIRDELKKIIDWTKNNIFSFILVICVTIMFFKSYKLVDISELKLDDVLDSFKISVTVLISMLGFSVSIYVFLNNTFQNRRNNNTIEKEMIDSFQQKKRKSLGISVIFSITVIVAECMIIFFKTPMKEWILKKSFYQQQEIYLECLVICITITLINVMILGYFTYGVINYEDGLKRLAKETRKAYETQSYYEEMNKGEFLNLVNNIEVLVERLVVNHLHAKTSTAYDSNLKRAICDGITDSGEICTREEFARDYQKIIEYRNLLLQDKCRDSDKVDMGDKIKSVMKRLFQLYLKNELLTGVNISNIDVTEANLSKTSFSNSSLQNINFKGKTVLQNTDLRNSTLNDIDFEEANCDNANFADSKLINVKFNTKMNLQRAIFTNADLSSMGILGPDDKEGMPIELSHTNFERANLTHMDIYNVCFDFANLSDVRLVDSQIGESAQKQNNTSFKHTDMTKADMLKCIIERCDFQNANLNEAILTYTKISQVDMTECRLCDASLAESIIKNCQFDKAYCTNMSLKGSRISSSTFTYATMTSVDMSGAIFYNVCFNDTVCRETLWVRTNISNSSFERCVFSGSRIVGETEKKTRIQKCNFSYANFSNSAITNVEFVNCDFEGADFSNVRFINVKFINCKNLETVLTVDVWLSKVEFLGENKSELKKPNKGWRYNDKS